MALPTQLENNSQFWLLHMTGHDRSEKPLLSEAF